MCIIGLQSVAREEIRRFSIEAGEAEILSQHRDPANIFPTLPKSTPLASPKYVDLIHNSKIIIFSRASLLRCGENKRNNKCYHEEANAVLNVLLFWACFPCCYDWLITWSNIFFVFSNFLSSLNSKSSENTEIENAFSRSAGRKETSSSGIVPMSRYISNTTISVSCMQTATEEDRFYWGVWGGAALGFAACGNSSAGFIGSIEIRFFIRNHKSLLKVKSENVINCLFLHIYVLVVIQ